MASTYLTRTPSSTGNDKIATFSAWIKRGSSLGSQNNLFTSFPETERTQLFFNGSGTLQLQSYSSGSATMNVETNRVFRDVNAWYHIVIAMDSTQATASDRVKFYVNGVQETSFAQSSYVSQNTTLSFNTSSRPFYLGTYNTSILFFDGSMSHVYWIDGTAYDASAFGETDTTTGEWEAKTSPSVTYGTNGFLILKDGNTITDQSSNSNDFTLGGGTLTDLKDNPENVFATLNPLANNNGSTFSNGNNTLQTASGAYAWNTATMGASSGKYYWEGKLSVNGTYADFGIHSTVAPNNSTYMFASAYGWSYNGTTGQIHNSNSGSSYGSTYTTNDIIGVALDLDNNKLYFSKNGTWQNSGVPTSGATGTGAISITTPDTGFYFPACGEDVDNNSCTWQLNFGNGYFGTTAITTNSGNGYSGAEGSSKFNYTVPTGYSALSTKGLNE